MTAPRILLFPALAACLAAQAPAPKTATPAPPPPSSKAEAFDKVVLSVGEEKFTVGELQQMIDALPEQYRNAARGAGKRQFAEQLIRLKLLSQEARRRKLDQTPLFQKQLALQRDNLLAGALFQDLSANSTIDEASSRRYYDQHKSEYEQVKGRHILVRMQGSPMPLPAEKKELTEEEALAKAQALRKRLLAGEDFSALAKAESDDTGSGANGGDLGFFKHGQMVPPFEQAAFSLPVGQLSEPVKTQFGFHLIQVEQKEAKTYEEVRGEIEKRMRPDIARQAVEDLRKQTPVTIDEAYFGPENPPAQGPQQPPAPK